MGGGVGDPWPIMVWMTLGVLILVVLALGVLALGTILTVVLT